MTTIRATCNFGCGDVKLSIDDVILRTCVGREGGEYRWKCKCGIVVRQAEENVVILLRSTGIEEEVWELPLELLERPVDGVLTEDDLVDLEVAFQDGSFWDKIVKK